MPVPTLVYMLCCVPFQLSLVQGCLLSVCPVLTPSTPSHSLNLRFLSVVPATLANQSVAMRPCVFCGKQIIAQLQRCPHCREEVPRVQLAFRPRTGGRQQIRRGLLYMLLAGVIQYFASGASGFTVPVQIPPPVTTYLAPAVFVSGLGLLIYGLVLRSKS